MLLFACPADTSGANGWLFSIVNNCGVTRFALVWICADSHFITVEAMKARVLPDLPDLETESEGHFTWNIKDWLKLQRREHGPTFEIGGIPWYVGYCCCGDTR